MTPRVLRASTSSRGCCSGRPAGSGSAAVALTAADEDDPPAAPLDVRVPLLGTQRLEEPELLQLLQGRLEPPLQLGRRIRTAQADVLAGQRPQVEVQPRSAVEPLVQEPIHPLGRRQPQLQVELQVELLEVAALEALEDHLVPAEARQGQGGLVGLRPAPVSLARLPRSRRGPPPLPVVERHVVQDVELLVDPALGRVVPPGVLVHQDHADPAVQRLLDPPVALATLRPAQELDQLVARELHPGVGEVAPPLRQLDQADQDLVVQRGRQAVLVRAHDRQPPDDRRTVATLQPILEDHRRLAVGDAIRQAAIGNSARLSSSFQPASGRGCPLVALAGRTRRSPPEARPTRPSRCPFAGVIRTIALVAASVASRLPDREKKNNNKTAPAVLLSFFLTRVYNKFSATQEVRK